MKSWLLALLTGVCVLSISVNIYMVWGKYKKQQNDDAIRSFINQVDSGWSEYSRTGKGIGPFTEFSAYQTSKDGNSSINYMEDGIKKSMPVPSDGEYMARCGYDGHGNSLVVLLRRK